MAHSTVDEQNALVSADLLDTLWSPSFPPVELVPVAAATIYDAAYIGRSVSRPAVAGYATEGPSCFVVVSPGSIRLTRSSPAVANRAKERAIARRAAVVEAHAGAMGADAALRAAQTVLGTLGGEWVDGSPFAAPELAEAASRRHVVEWSSKSRANMARRLTTLDYAPLFAEGLVPAMITLTMPEDWQTYAPTAAAFKRRVRMFQKRYRRAWGREIAGVWKLEFQRRGAPHLHALIAPPRGVAHDRRRAGLTWREWFAQTWADCLGVEGETRQRVLAVHRHVKACADYAEGLRMTDPKRVGVYFSKHGLLIDKEYQHVVPAEWREAGPGRFWGVWVLQPVEQSAEVTFDEAVRLARTLRRLERSRGGTRRAKVFRTDTRTGVVSTRTVRRPVRRLRGTFGFLAANDGPALAMVVSRVLEVVPPPGELSGVGG